GHPPQCGLPEGHRPAEPAARAGGGGGTGPGVRAGPDPDRPVGDQLNRSPPIPRFQRIQHHYKRKQLGVNMSSASTHGSTPYYFVPGLSRHPALAAFGLFFVILGASQWVNGAQWGKWSLAFGLLFWLTVLFQWFSDAIEIGRAHV